MHRLRRCAHYPSMPGDAMMATSMKNSATISIDCATCQARVDGLCEGYGPDVLRVIASHKSGERRVKSGQDRLSLGEPCAQIYLPVDREMRSASVEGSVGQ